MVNRQERAARGEGRDWKGERCVKNGKEREGAVGKR